MKTILLCLICSLLFVKTTAQTLSPDLQLKQYYFMTYDIKNGLSHNTVNTIIQDKLGFLWIGTKDGLDRFDGVTFRAFNKENSNLGNNYVTKLFEDNNGKIWVGTDAGMYIYDPVFETFYTLRQYTGTNTDVTHTVSRIKEDAQHNIWFAVDYEGLYCFNIRTRKLTQPVKISKSGQMANISEFCFTGNTCWLGLYNDNLYLANDKFKSLRPFRTNGKSLPFHKDIINQMAVNGSTLYVCTAKGLFELNMKTLLCKKLLDGYVRTLAFKKDELWAGTENGLYVHNVKTGITDHVLASDIHDPYALADNAIYTIFRDRDDGMWIGSYFGGVNYYPVSFNHFEKYYPRNGSAFTGRRVREFCKGNDGTVWFGTEDKGLFNFNPQTKLITPFHDHKIYPNVHGLCLDDHYLWAGTFTGGLNRIDLRTKQVKNYRQGDASNSLSSNDIFSIYRTRSGKLWIGTVSGLMTYNRATDDFTRIPELANKFIYNILEDTNGDMWFATYANGVYRYSPGKRTWRTYTFNQGDPYSLSYNKVISIYQDSHRRLWFMTQGGGLCLYNARTDNFKRYDMRNGFPSNIIYRMVEDNHGLLWITTNKGLVCFNPSNQFLKVYTTADGLLSNQFNYQSGIKTDNGTIYMGCIDGFIVFNPATFKDNPVPAPIYITELYVFNNHVKVGGKDSPLKHSLLYSNEISLHANENSFALQTANLSFRPAERNDLQYLLEGFDREWHTVNKDGMIYFSNLPYRNYTLRIRGVGRDGKWNGSERTLEINVLPPFYLSFWAYLLYILLILCGAGYIAFRIKERIQQRQKKAMRAFEQEKERELYNSKITFFTNITHEIRTPLTLIKGPLDNILSDTGNLPPKIKKDLEMMNVSTNRLLVLVNQLLDFRKVEGNQLRLNFVKSDISLLLHNLCRPFEAALDKRHIRFDTAIDNDMELPVDVEAFTKIISNLLTNAMKHAQHYVSVKAGIHDERLIISVANDGEIIPLSMREDIFKPFIQFKGKDSETGSGTGLGLTLSRTLAELHHGTLAMNSSEEENCFILTLPIKQADEIKVQASASETLPDTETETVEKSGDTPSDYTLLVVEDNKEMLRFIVETLTPKFTILTAENGKEAIEVLKGHLINLVISDVMMPEMDGIALCNWIKNTFDYSHIPVILLTAKTALSAKIEGTNSGADAYIEKPFSVVLLKAEISNLLRNRENLRKIFTEAPYIQTNSMSISKADKDFIKQIHEIVSTNMKDAEFSPDVLAKELNMSRSSLNRKFKGLMNLTPNDYIQSERLRKAAQMLKEGETRIGEVCWNCGFNTPSYFTKCFKKQFGVLPKDFVNKDRQDNQ